MALLRAERRAKLCAMGRKLGFSWSWKRASGLSGAKGRLSREIGIPLTRSGRERKLGRLLMGGWLPLMGRGSRSARSARGGPMVIAVCPYCRHQQQIRSTTLGAVKKCVACGRDFRPELKHAMSRWRFLFGTTILIVGVWFWVTHKPAPQDKTEPAAIDPPNAAVKPQAPAVAAQPRPTPHVPGPSA